MSFRTKPGYTADSQAEITSDVPDDEDGITAFAISEQTAWQLSKTSSATVGTNVLATKSGTGRWLRMSLATDSASAYDDFFYGMGVDGAATFAVNTSPGDTRQYTTLTVNAGILVTLPNYALQCSTSLSLLAGAIIASDGTSGTVDSTSGAAGLAANQLGVAGTAGGSGGSAGNNGSNASGSTRSLGGLGGAGGNNPPRTGGNAGPLGAITGLGVFDVFGLQWRNGSPTFVLPSGGTPGGGGAGGATGPGGGGGSGGGLLLVRAKAITVAAGALFRAKGGAGSNRTTLDGSGGGGGGGGVVIVVCNSWTMPGGASYADFFDVTGGAGGTSAGGLAGNAGSSGRVRLYVGGQLVYSLN